VGIVLLTQKYITGLKAGQASLSGHTPWTTPSALSTSAWKHYNLLKTDVIFTDFRITGITLDSKGQKGARLS